MPVSGIVGAFIPITCVSISCTSSSARLTAAVTECAISTTSRDFSRYTVVGGLEFSEISFCNVARIRSVFARALHAPVAAVPWQLYCERGGLLSLFVMHEGAWHIAQLLPCDATFASRSARKGPENSAAGSSQPASPFSNLLSFWQHAIYLHACAKAIARQC